MVTWPHHIDCFKHQYSKAFAEHRFFGEDILDWIHKRVQFFLHSCNRMSLEDVETVSLAEFGGLQRRLERCEWIKPPPFRLGRDSGAK